METTIRRNPIGSRLVIAFSLVVLLAMAGVGGAVASRTFFNTAAAAPALYNEDQMINLYKTNSPAVVEINVTGQSSNRFRSSFFATSQGSGFLVDTAGHILTNYHVVQSATSVQVTLSDGRTLDARITGTSPADDLALLTVDPNDVSRITPLALGDSSQLQPGQMAVALGSPFGLQNSVTVGVVSGVNRTQSSGVGRPITGMVQTDASINPGNSGGPLLDSQGEVIGINTAIETSPTGGATGVGFAIPINTAKNVMAQLLSNNSTVLKRPWLGIRGMALAPDVAAQLSISPTSGVYIISVTSGSPAEAAGLVAAGTGSDGMPGTGGDVIMAADGHRVSSVDDIAGYFNSLQPGNEVDLTVLRDGQTVHVSVTLGEWPEAIPGSPQ